MKNRIAHLAFRLFDLVVLATTLPPALLIFLFGFIKTGAFKIAKRRFLNLSHCFDDFLVFRSSQCFSREQYRCWGFEHLPICCWFVLGEQRCSCAGLVPDFSKEVERGLRDFTSHWQVLLVRLTHILVDSVRDCGG
jgi:hypothetical protein